MRSLLLVLALLLPALAGAAPIEGRVLDDETGAPLAFANVWIRSSDMGAISNRDGSFRLPGREGAALTLVVSYLNYETKTVTVPPGAGPMELRLVRSVIIEDPILVTATRLRPHVDPVPIKNMDRETLETRYWAQDPPMLLAETPGVYAYNEGGSGLGNSYLTLRGFGQNRVAVMINGIPLNGGDSHEVWWVDLPDFAASLKDLQVQRGVMGSLYGSTALGGCINLVTDSFARERSLRLTTGMGSWNTRKASVEVASGLLDGALSFNGRISRLETDGYREQSWMKSWAYFANLSRRGESSTTRLNFYGGPENTHLAYKGITREQLDTDRRHNPLNWEDEEDRFHQPHFELHHDWQIRSGRSLASKLFFTLGEGYYEQRREGRSAFEYNLVEDPDDDYDTDLVRRRTVDEWDGGLIEQLNLESGRHALSLGGELRLHRSHHFADVRWALVYPASLPQYHRYYDYRVDKTGLSAFLRDRIALSENWSLDAALQVQHHRFALDNDKRFAVAYERNFTFLSPRLGLVWQQAPGRSFFASAAHGTREPSHKDIYNAGDFWAGPGGEIMQEYWGNDSYVSHFDQSGGGLAYIGPEAKPEKVLDLELGGRLSGRRYALDWTLYFMDFHDEIVPYAGAQDDNQYPNNGNAESSRHMGLELGGKLRVWQSWTLSGAASFTRDRFIKYTEFGYDWDEYEPVVTNYDGQVIPGYPIHNWQLRLEGELLGVDLWSSLRNVGRQYLDGGNLDARSVEPHRLVDAGLSLALPGFSPLKGARLTARVNNLLDVEYESAGYIEYDDLEPRWFVGAPRNWYLGLSLDF